MSILVLGALHWDVVVDAPRLPRLGETLTGTGVDYRFGGKGGNQAVAAARMGARVAMSGRVGRDAAGRSCLAALDAAGIDRSRVTEAGAPTGMSVAVTEAAGDYGAVIVSGANLLNDGAVELPADCRICLIQNEIPEAANLSLAARLPPGCRLILNAAPARSLPDALADRVDILIANQGEAADLTGETDPEAAARALCARGIGAVIVTLGGDGLILMDKRGLHAEPAFPVPVVSTHGAGDMFTGALAAELWRGADLRAALPFAQAAAALLVSSPIDGRGRIDEARARAASLQTGAS